MKLLCKKSQKMSRDTALPPHLLFVDIVEPPCPPEECHVLFEWPLIGLLIFYVNFDRTNMLSIVINYQKNRLATISFIGLTPEKNSF